MRPSRRNVRPSLAAALARWIAAAGVVVAIYEFAHRGAAAANPIFHEVTFRNGTVWAARFARTDKPSFTVLPGRSTAGNFFHPLRQHRLPNARLPPAQILSVSSKGRWRFPASHDHRRFAQGGTLARVPLAGGAPREVLDKVFWADWTPMANLLPWCAPALWLLCTWNFRWAM